MWRLLTALRCPTLLLGGSLLYLLFLIQLLVRLTLGDRLPLYFALLKNSTDLSEVQELVNMLDLRLHDLVLKPESILMRGKDRRLGRVTTDRDHVLLHGSIVVPFIPLVILL